MKNFILSLVILLGVQSFAIAQKDDDEKKGFKKENFFTGGSISLSFSSYSFLVGGNPVFGYSLAKWADVGIVGNYTYSSFRDYPYLGDRLHQTVYGGGFFTRLFPVRFLFLQGQIEHNWMGSTYFPYDNSTRQKTNLASNSLLVGAGYTTGRDPSGKSVYGYLAVLWDVMNDRNSPYVDNYGRAIPIIRAGFNVALFQGKGGR
ncbi:MAG: hypothetical protein ACJ75B_14875 [Flavisolibacter sp.]